MAEGTPQANLLEGSSGDDLARCAVGVRCDPSSRSQARRGPGLVFPSLVDSNYTRTESCVAIRPDPELRARSGLRRATIH